MCEDCGDRGYPPALSNEELTTRLTQLENQFYKLKNQVLRLPDDVKTINGELRIGYIGGSKRLDVIEHAIETLVRAIDGTLEPPSENTLRFKARMDGRGK